jgi:hypothetical protein
MTLAETGKQVTVTVPTLLHDASPLAVTVTSQNPAVAVPTGAVAGSLLLNFAAGSADSQTFTVTPVGKGTTSFTVTSVPANCAVGAVTVEVVAVPQVLLSDDFAAAQVDPTKWTIDTLPFDTGTATAESGVTITNGQVKIDVTAETSLWPGFALYTVTNFDATQTAPVTFELDRTLLEFVLVTGTGAEERSGMYVKDPSGNFVFFNEYVAHDGRNFGWRYNKVTGQADDDAIGAGVNIPAFDGGNYDNQGNHKMKIVVNGVDAKLYLDGVLGSTVPFPFSQDLTFGFAAYADETGNVTRGYFDNAKVSGGESVIQTVRLTAAVQTTDIIISWTGTGTLEQSDTLQTASWSAVTPAPTGNTLTIPKSQAALHRYYRVRQ